MEKKTHNLAALMTTLLFQLEKFTSGGGGASAGERCVRGLTVAGWLVAELVAQIPPDRIILFLEHAVPEQPESGWLGSTEAVAVGCGSLVEGQTTASRSKKSESFYPLVQKLMELACAYEVNELEYGAEVATAGVSFLLVLLGAQVYQNPSVDTNNSELSSPIVSAKPALPVLDFIMAEAARQEQAFHHGCAEPGWGRTFTLTTLMRLASSPVAMAEKPHTSGSGLSNSLSTSHLSTTSNSNIDISGQTQDTSTPCEPSLLERASTFLAFPLWYVYYVVRLTIPFAAILVQRSSRRLLQAPSTPTPTAASSGVLDRRAQTTGSLLADRSLLLLLILVHNYRSGQIGNAFRNALNCMEDSSYKGTLEEEAINAARVPRTDYHRLVKSLGRILPWDPSLLLFYTILQGNHMFMDTILSCSDLEVVIVPVLRQIYQADQAKHPSQLYVAIIVLLTFSQDLSFGINAFRHLQVSSVDFYKERNLGDINLGSLLLLCLLRVILHDLNHMKDIYLLQNCFAIMLNIAPHIENIHVYTAQRFADVFLVTMKKYIKAGEKIQKHAQNKTDADDQLDENFAALGETLQVILKVINYAVRPHVIHHNIKMIYALLYGQNEVLKWIDSPLVSQSGWLGEVPGLLNHFLAFVKDKDVSTVDNTLAVISDGIKALPSYADTLVAGFQPPQEDAKMMYEEGQDPEYFFVPYAWKVAFQDTKTDLHWVPERILLFAST